MHLVGQAVSPVTSKFRDFLSRPVGLARYLQVNHGDNGLTVLVVDDDRSVLGLTETVLRSRGYFVMTAASPHVALEKIRLFEGEIHLLLTDIVMPQVDGITLAQQVLVERPRIRVLLMSGYSETRSRLPFLRKPFQVRDLLEKISAVLAAPLPRFPGTDPDGKVAAETENFLTAELDAARQRYIDASRKFLHITKDSPQGIPASDGILRIQNASAVQQRAFEEYQRARQKLADYLEQK